MGYIFGEGCVPGGMKMCRLVPLMTSFNTEVSVNLKAAKKFVTVLINTRSIKLKTK